MGEGLSYSHRIEGPSAGKDSFPLHAGMGTIWAERR
jgi:hypothetical protein